MPSCNSVADTVMPCSAAMFNNLRSIFVAIFSAFLVKNQVPTVFIPPRRYRTIGQDDINAKGQDFSRRPAPTGHDMKKTAYFGAADMPATEFSPVLAQSRRRCVIHETQSQHLPT